MKERKKGKVGRPRKIPEITPELLQRIEKYAGLLLTHEEIAIILGIGERTFREMMERDPVISAVYKKGFQSVKYQAVSTLRTVIKDGEVRDKLTACMFLLKTRFGFREKEKTDNTEKTEDTANQMLELAKILKEAYKK